MTHSKLTGGRAFAQPHEGGVMLLACLLGGVVFGLLAYASVELTRGDGRIAAVWLPNAIAVAFLLRIRLPREQLFIMSLWLGNSLANVVGGDAMLGAVTLAACNAIEIQLATSLTRRWCGTRPDMLDPAHLLRFVIAAAVVAPAVSATMATLSLGIGNADPAIGWLKWAMSDGLGMVVIAPSIVVLIDAATSPERVSKARLLEWFAIVFGGALATGAIFGLTTLPLLFLSAPIVFLHAFRLGAVGTVVCVWVTAAIATVYTSQGVGPINLIDAPLTMKLIVLQVYLASVFFMGLPVAAMLKRRDRIIDTLAQKQRELSLLADSITDAVLQYAPDGTCVYASRSVESVLGAPAETFLGKRASDRAHPESRRILANAEQRLLSGRSEHERCTYRRYLDDEAGHPIYIEADAVIARNQETGAAEGIVVAARDVTDRVELELQLTRARRHAENAARAKSEFLANMSHEIRTPMNGVLGFAELLMQADLSEEQKHHAELIVQSGRSMMLLLNDILDLSKIEAGQIVIDREPVEIDGLVRECAALHRASAEKKGLHLQVEPVEEQPCILTDGLRLRQIILNLIGNAVKFTEDGDITVRYRIAAEQLLVEVEDTGIGISPERIERIFQPFEQGENDTARRFGGTGLGLSISRQLSELLGGYLDVTSQPGLGSKFTVSIPAIPATRRPVVNVAACGQANTPLPHAARILLAEDHDVNRMLVTAMLERCGQNVTVAKDGDAAIHAVLESHARGIPYELVLMDIQMPGCDGYAATRVIRAEGIRPDQLPIIALTANAYPEDIAAAREAGMQGHLAKPLAFAELVQALQRWLPTRIVDEYAQEADKAGKNSAADSIVHSPALIGRWRERRKEALEAVSEALQAESLIGEDADRLARMVHKLAGTAGMFGEEALGERAAELERALRSEARKDVRKRLAEELLDAAGPTPRER